jgi:hypothetical protein
MLGRERLVCFKEMVVEDGARTGKITLRERAV